MGEQDADAVVAPRRDDASIVSLAPIHRYFDAK